MTRIIDHALPATFPLIVTAILCGGAFLLNALAAGAKLAGRGEIPHHFDAGDRTLRPPASDPSRAEVDHSEVGG